MIVVQILKTWSRKYAKKGALAKVQEHTRMMQNFFKEASKSDNRRGCILCGSNPTPYHITLVTYQLTSYMRKGSF